jgi:uncharacterized protein (DUF302 family)
MLAETIAVDYPSDGPVGPGRQKVYRSPLDTEATVAALEAAIAAADLWVVAKLDPKMLLAKGGYTIRPTRQLFYFHPRYMSRLLATNPAGIVEAPLKFVVLEGTDGTVTVRHPDNAAAFAAYPGLGDLAAELDAVTSQIVTAVVN